MIVLYSIVGESPGVVSEAIKWIKNKYREEITSVVFYPKSENIKKRIEILKEVIETDFDTVNQIYKEISIDDVKNDKDMVKLIREIRSYISTLPDNEESIKILNVSGGRKIMSIILSVYFPFIFREINKIINVVSYVDREKILNAEKVVLSANNIKDLKTKNKEEYETYFYSDNNFKVFELNIIPYPKVYKNMILGFSNRPLFNEVKTAYSQYIDEINRMIKLGIVRIENGRIEPLEFLKSLI